MSEPQWVHIVTLGCESNYEIDRVYLNKDEADQYVAKMNADVKPEWGCHYRRQVECYVVGHPFGEPAEDYAPEMTVSPPSAGT